MLLGGSGETIPPVINQLTIEKGKRSSSTMLTQLCLCGSEHIALSFDTCHLGIQWWPQKSCSLLEPLSCISFNICGQIHPKLRLH